jgi:hypothetical protein
LGTKPVAHAWKGCVQLPLLIITGTFDLSMYTHHAYAAVDSAGWHCQGLCLCCVTACAACTCVGLPLACLAHACPLRLVECCCLLQLWQWQQEIMRRLTPAMRAYVVHIQRVAAAPSNAWCCAATAAFARSYDAIARVRPFTARCLSLYGGASGLVWCALARQFVTHCDRTLACYPH